MMKKLFALGVLSLILTGRMVPAHGEEIKVDFDGKKSAPGSILDRIRGGDGPAPMSLPKGTPVTLRTERDCVTVSFDAKDELVSQKIPLESREYRQVCTPLPNGGQSCREELAWTYRVWARIQITDRGPMLPWEHDVFWMCLDGRWLEGDVIDASHKFDLKWTGASYDATLNAKAGAKVPSLPDANGIEAGAPVTAGDNLALTLNDKWAEFYKGDKTVLSVQLKRVRDIWADPIVVEKEIVLDPAASTTVRFADYAADFSEKLRTGSKYYVNWRFKRLGQVSKDRWMKHRETGKAVFGQAEVSSIPTPSEAAAQALKTCWLRTIEADQCVYTCSDKTEHRQRVMSPDPLHPEEPVAACPQLVFPF
ncbi:MAG: hypothetical protein WC943_17400 [Elusimicrobiota bacterium]|jgi:hypothetical protein